MTTELQGNWDALAEVESMSSASARHVAWMASYTDSVASPQQFRRYQQDSLLRVEVARMDARFQSWFEQQVFSTRSLRLHLTDVSRWLDRIKTEKQSATWVDRNWAARQETFARLLSGCRKVQDQYLSLMEEYARFEAETTPPEDV